MVGSSAMHHDYRVLRQILKVTQKTKTPMNGAFQGLFDDQPLFHWPTWALRKEPSEFMEAILASSIWYCLSMLAWR